LCSRVVLVLGVAGIVAYFFLPPELASYAYDVFGLAAVAAAAVRVADRRTAGRGAWAAFGLGALCWVVGDLLFTYLDATHADGAPFPSSADAFYLLGAPVLAVALVRAARARNARRDLPSTLDGIVVALAAIVPLYAFWVQPALADTTQDLLARIISVAYPLTDLVLLAAGIRLALGGGGWNRTGALLGGGLALTIIADVAYNIQVLADTYVMPSPADAGWLLAYVMWAGAALDPAARDFLSPVTRSRRLSGRTRMAVLASAVLLPLGVVADAYVRSVALDGTVIMATLAAITVVMAVRLRHAARSGSTRWRGAGLLFSAAVVVIAMAVGLTQVHQHHQRRTEIRESLLHAEESLERVHAIAAEVRSGRQPAWPATRREMAVLAERVDDAVEGLRRGDLGSYPPGDLHRALHRYLAGLDTELEHRADGELVLASRTVRARTGPDYRVLRAALRRALGVSGMNLTASGRTERLGSVVVLGLSLCMLIVLFLKYGGARRASEVAHERSRVVRESEARFRALIGASADIITVIAPDTTVIAHPETVERVLGLPAGSVLGTRLDAGLRPQDAEATWTVLAALEGRAGAADTIEWRLRRADGTSLDAEVLIVNHVEDPLLGGFVLNVRDVTERKRLEDQLQHQAFHDHLTRLANRALLEDRIRHALERGARSASAQAVLFLDLDDFKAVNDSLGHSVGDELLVEVATRLRACVRPSDTLARVGGDEFALLMEDVDDVETAVGAARRLLAALAEPVVLGGREHVIRASIGVALNDGSGPGDVRERTERLLQDADLAMYEAKRQGAGHLELFAPSMHQAVTRRMQLKSELELGLQRGEFVIRYQPIMDLDGGAVAGFEALVRWEHPERGMVSPADFIPIAEQTGLILELGDWVLHEACRQLAEWQREWPEERYVAVNVAGLQLQRDAFVEEVAAALRESGLAPRQLLLEVTETALIQDTEGNESRMIALRDLGVRLAIDDFGTGYSSLSYLRRFPMDVLKIDKSFVDHIAETGRDSALVEAMVKMGSSLDLRVVAEGIEDLGQLEALRTLHCALGQGYLFARPLDPGDVRGFVAGVPVSA
jgi:diguanylate cyclase (GGDEF)-like protein/PAS domain S-box-containing protein